MSPLGQHLVTAMISAKYKALTKYGSFSCSTMVTNEGRCKQPSTSLTPVSRLFCLNILLWNILYIVLDNDYYEPPSKPRNVQADNFPAFVTKVLRSTNHKFRPFPRSSFLILQQDMASYQVYSCPNSVVTSIASKHCLRGGRAHPITRALCPVNIVKAASR